MGFRVVFRQYAFRKSESFREPKKVRRFVVGSVWLHPEHFWVTNDLLMIYSYLWWTTSGRRANFKKRKFIFTKCLIGRGISLKIDFFDIFALSERFFRTYTLASVGGGTVPPRKTGSACVRTHDARTVGRTTLKRNPQSCFVARS